VEAPSNIIKELNAINMQPYNNFYKSLSIPNTLATNQLAQERADAYPADIQSQIALRNAQASGIPSEIGLREAQTSNLGTTQQQTQLNMVQGLIRQRMAAKMNDIDPDSLGIPDPMKMLQGNGVMPSNLPITDNQLGTIDNRVANIAQPMLRNDNARKLAGIGFDVKGTPDANAPATSSLNPNNIETPAKNIMKDYYDNLDNAKQKQKYAQVMTNDLNAGQHFVDAALKGTPIQNEIMKSDRTRLDAGAQSDAAATNLLQDVNQYNALLKKMTKEQFSYLQRGNYQKAFGGDYNIAIHLGQDMMINASHMYGLPAKMMTDKEMDQLRGAFGDPNQPLHGLQGNLRLISELAQKAIVNHRMMVNKFNDDYTTYNYVPWDGDLKKVPKNIRQSLLPLIPKDNDFNYPKE